MGWQQQTFILYLKFRTGTHYLNKWLKTEQKSRRGQNSTRLNLRRAVQLGAEQRPK